MTKIVEIDCCDGCLHFDDDYYSYNEICTLLKRVIERDNTIGYHHIPKDCPLEESK